MRIAAVLFLLLLSGAVLRAQTISGVVLDEASGAPVSDVAIQNVYTDGALVTDASGRFSIGASAGQLIELHKVGYKVRRLRIPSASMPFCRIFLEPGITELDEVEVRSHYDDFAHDSMRYREVFKKEIDYPVLTGWRAIQSPFSALGKTNQQMIHFQKEYVWLEHIKYVDYAFNEKIIANLTGLKGDSAVAYMQRYRPSYEVLRAMPDYARFTYIKQTVELWRQRQRGGPSNGRGSGGG